MTEEELKSIATKGDLENLHHKIIKDLEGILKGKNPQKEFYTIKEWCHITGDNPKTVNYRCQTGKLKARQDAPGCTWFIWATELTRFQSESQTETN